MKSPTFSEIDLSFVARELQELEIGSGVNAVYSVNKSDLIIQLRNHWYISVEPKNFRIHRSDPQDLTLMDSPLERFLKGKKLTRVGFPVGERVLYLEFTGKTALGEPEIYILCVELMGKYSNVILINHNKRVVWAIKRVTERESTIRPIYPGAIYKTPPPKPWSVFSCDDNQHAAIVSKYFPWVPDKHQPCKWLRSYLKNAEQDLDPIVVVVKDTLYVLPVPVSGVDTLKKVNSFSEGLEFIYSLSYSPEQSEAKIPFNVIKEWERVREYPKYLFIAEEVAKRYQELVEKREIDVEWQGVQETIKLAENESPDNLIQKYHRIYNRLKRGYEKLKPLIEGKVKRVSVEKTDAKTKEKPRVKHGQTISGVYEVVSPSGFKVLIGKSGKGNETVTFKLASREDYFFHVKGYPGAHVILKCGKTEPDDADIQFCARKALEHSALRGERKGTVLYTRCKYLRRPKGGKPGLVLVTKEETISVRI